ncbi:MAG: thiol-disulfide oxidoreductase DCC family protein [Ignavibacteriales bacterium]
MPDKQIILFDGVCNFCNYWVNFILDRDKKDLYGFSALQSEYGQKILEKIGMSSTDFQTFILVKDEKFYTKSSAALMIVKNLSGPIKIIYPFIFLPKFLRDFFYDLIAKNRYRMFGKRNVCRIPTEEEKAKFID